jgi:hypothetical protein
VDRSRQAITVAVAVVGLAAVAMVGLVTDLLTRPPCPPRYVRLVDIEAVLPVAAAILGLLAGGLLLIVRSLRRQQRPVGLWVVVVAVSLLPPTGLLAVAGVVTNTDNGAQYDSGCWTF